MSAVDIFEKEKAAIEQAGDMPEPLPPMTEAELLARFIYLSRTDEVCDLERPRLAMSVGHFKNYVAASVLEVTVEGRGKKPTTKRIRLSQAWVESPLRGMRDTRTWRPGFGQFTEDPNGFTAVNIWEEPGQDEPPHDWLALAQPFLAHVEYLVPKADERERFLDWLAHIVQRPGEVPHSHYLMIAENTQGIGRNLLATFLHGVLKGHVQPTVNLASVMEGRFNAELSEKLLAVVDELHEGGGGSQWKFAEQLKTELTRSFRRIKPKYGKEHDEYNCLRWLMFSNHTSALPLTDEDRRFHVIQNPTVPRDQDYYAKLYALASDEATLRSILEWLRRRDISKFNPGERPPMNEMKKRLIQSSIPEPELLLRELLQDYPGDLMYRSGLELYLFGKTLGFEDKKQAAALRHMLNRYGCQTRQVTTSRTEGRKKLSVVMLRNSSTWLAAATEAFVARLRKDDQAWQTMNGGGKF